jgi:hypothetical protein
MPEIAEANMMGEIRSALSKVGGQRNAIRPVQMSRRSSFSELDLSELSRSTATTRRRRRSSDNIGPVSNDVESPVPFIIRKAGFALQRRLFGLRSPKESYLVLRSSSLEIYDSCVHQAECRPRRSVLLIGAAVSVQGSDVCIRQPSGKKHRLSTVSSPSEWAAEIAHVITLVTDVSTNTIAVEPRQS